MIIRFSLARPAVVRFVIVLEAPDCTRIGSFTIRGKRGLNRVAFTGRFRGDILPPGTYSLAATAFRGGRAVALGRTRVVVVEPGERATKARVAASMCSRGIGASVRRPGLSGSSASAAPAEGGGGGGGAAEAIRSATSGAAGEASANDVAGAEAGATGGADARDGRILGVLPHPFEGAPGWLQPLLLSVLGASILLLVAAALPATAVRPAGAAPVVDRRRSELALVGAALLAVVALSALVL